jgi:type II secretory pathway component PulM
MGFSGALLSLGALYASLVASASPLTSNCLPDDTEAARAWLDLESEIKPLFYERVYDQVSNDSMVNDSIHSCIYAPALWGPVWTPACAEVKTREQKAKSACWKKTEDFYRRSVASEAEAQITALSRITGHAVELPSELKSQIVTSLRQNGYISEQNAKGIYQVCVEVLKGATEQLVRHAFVISEHKQAGAHLNRANLEQLQNFLGQLENSLCEVRGLPNHGPQARSGFSEIKDEVCQDSLRKAKFTDSVSFLKNWVDQALASSLASLPRCISSSKVKAQTARKKNQAAYRTTQGEL